MEEQNTENPTEVTQAEASQLNAAAGSEAESVATDNANSLSLDEINAATGMNYKDRDSALKSIKDMKSQAGKAADLEGKIKAAQADPDTSDDAVQALQEQLNSLSQQLNQAQTDNFFSSNDEYSANRELIEKLARADGVSPAEVVESDMYKSVAKQPEKRTVATSNNRVAQGSEDKQFNPAEHAGDADALAKYVTETYLTK